MDNGSRLVGECLGKEVIALKDGSFLGKVQSMVVNAEAKEITGLTIKLKGLLSGKMFIALHNIEGFGAHGITVQEEFRPEESKTIEDKEIIGMPVITSQGTLLGKVSDFAFELKTGIITNYILTGGIVKDTFQKRAILEASDVLRIGKDVIIASALLEELKIVDDLKEEFTEPELIDDAFNLEDHQPEIDKITENQEPLKSWVEALNEAKKVTEQWKDNLLEQGSKLGVEAKEIKDTGQKKLEGFLGEAQKKAEEQLDKLNKVKDLWEEKLNKIKTKSDDELGEQLLTELKGKTISKALYGLDAQPLILPGEIIDEDIIKKAIAEGKIQDLFVLIATKDVEDEIEKIDYPDQNA